MAEHGLSKAGKFRQEIAVKLDKHGNLNEKRVNPAHLEVCTVILSLSLTYFWVLQFLKTVALLAFSSFLPGLTMNPCFPFVIQSFTSSIMMEYVVHPN